MKIFVRFTLYFLTGVVIASMLFKSCEGNDGTKDSIQEFTENDYKSIMIDRDTICNKMKPLGTSYDEYNCEIFHYFSPLKYPLTEIQWAVAAVVV